MRGRSDLRPTGRDRLRADADGLLCERLPQTRAPKLICVTPSHQFPLGSVLSLPRRLALLRYAQAHGSWILEDDYDGEFRYGGAPLAALRSLDGKDRTLYVGTFSKTLFPSLRLGYMVLPAALRASFRIAKLFATFGSPVVEQRALAHFICDRGFEQHLRRAAPRRAYPACAPCGPARRPAQTCKRCGRGAGFAGRHASGRMVARFRCTTHAAADR